MFDIVKRNPLFSDLDLWPRFDTIFDEVTRPYSRVQAMELGKPYSVDLPGVKKEDVDVELDGRRLTISWTRGEAKGQVYTYVPEGTEEIKAALDLGVLTLTPVGDAQQAKKRKVKIE